jgi:hypothetical protein
VACKICNGTGAADTGGFLPWGESIFAPCECIRCSQTPGDHEWELVDDSYDHEYGTEKIVFERCSACGLTRDYIQPTFDDDVI